MRIADNHEGYRQRRIALGVVPAVQVSEPVSTGCVQGKCPLWVMVRACYAVLKMTSTATPENKDSE